ncbi:FecR family protein [uncultured Bacteroides sp.]|uniref:FecR family protein n=1 Tax=uncultured Bacteroides sp. TaxID=162156 RepID=UPI0025F99096|nr:FecR family protein [uncultured Bacteroides sp.]
MSDETIKIVAEQSRMHVLPDSTKVWMEAGSSIKYAKAFNLNREVWLEGNSLFEVCRHEGSTFKVYITKAFIEVKGTFFLVKQQNSEKNEITLFNGKIEFNVESTGEKTIMKPLQKMIYNPTSAQTQLTDINNLNWENGKYTFTNTPLQKLIEIINQMYDTNIVLSNAIEHESAFTGSIRYDESLEDVLSKVCFTLNLSREKKGKHIIIKYQ